MSLPDGAWVGIGHLYVAAVFVGGMWQVETDFACFLAKPSAGFIYVNAAYDWKTIFINLLVYSVLHSFFFYISTRVLGATWAEKTIDVQVGWGGFGFYIAGNYMAEPGNMATAKTGASAAKSVHGYLMRSCNAGFWTFFYSIFPAIAYLIWW